MKLNAVLSICLATCLSLTSTSAVAGWKDTSGGNGVGGTLLDQHEADESEDLTGEAVLFALIPEFHARFSEMPLLQRYAEDLTIKRKSALAWILDDRRLAKECLNQSALSLPEQKILACQNDVEVRINKTFWRSSTKTERANLLLHEVVTSMALQRGTIRGIRPVTSAFLRSEKAHAEVALQFVNSGFPYLPLAKETQNILEFMAKVSSATCSLTDDRKALVLMADLLVPFQEAHGYETAALATLAGHEMLDLQKQYACKASVIIPHFESLFSAWKKQLEVQ